MNAKELKELLSKIPDDAEIIVCVSSSVPKSEDSGLFEDNATDAYASGGHFYIVAQ